MDLVTLFDHALEAHRSGDLNTARRIYQRIVKRNPEHASSWMNLGLVHQSLGATDEALVALKRAINLAPHHGGAHYNLGNTLRDRGETEAAIAAYKQTLDIDPEFVDAHNNLGEILMRQEDRSVAIDQFRRGLNKQPEHVGLRINLGNALFHEGEIEEALDQLTEAQKIAPNFAIVYRNLGNILRTSGRIREAEDTLERAIELAPNDASSRVLLAFCKLSAEQFGLGWDAYAWRWVTEEHEPARKFPAPFWAGESLNNKKLLIWGEQAVGDELMFSGMYSDFLDVGAEVYVETEYRLQPLFQRSFPDFKVFSRRDPPDTNLTNILFDYQIAAGDLGRYLRRSIADFPVSRPALIADEQRTTDLRKRYKTYASGRRLVGLSWQSKNEQAGVQRSVSLEALRPLLERPEVLFINLQYGDTVKELQKIANFGVDIINDPLINPLEDLDGAAAQIASLDLVVTAANTTAHLSGAMGIPTWVILSKFPDWRWGTSAATTPWYSSVHLCRQQKHADWRHPIEAINAIL